MGKKGNYLPFHFLLLAVTLLCSVVAQAQSKSILNVSYDPTRDLYKQFNKSFIEYWKKESGEDLEVKQSHGGSGKQARSVIDGLEADVVTLALAYDIDQIAEKTGALKSDWQKSLPNNSAPYTSTIVFLVKKGNPKSIKDWDDLVKDGIQVITPNPKTSGGARWNYLAAYGYALNKNNKDKEKAKEFIQKLFKNVTVLDAGARASTTTFAQRQIGDVLITWENEAHLAVNEFSSDNLEVVIPSLSILAEPTVALVDKVVDKKGTRKEAEAYLNYLYSESGQRIAAKNFYRPTNPAVAVEFKDKFPVIKMLTVDNDFGGWKSAQEAHFNDGGLFDQIYENK